MDRKNFSRKGSLTKLVIRDCALPLRVLLLISQPENLFAQYLLGALLGVIFYLFHEWAHLFGALLSRSIVAYPETVISPLSCFDSQANSVLQFVSMTVGGFFATAILLSVYLMFLPREMFGEVLHFTFPSFLTGLTVFIRIAHCYLDFSCLANCSVEIPFISHNPLLEKISGILANLRRKLGSDPRN